MFEVLVFVAASVLLALATLWGFFHFLVSIVGIDDTDRKPVMPWLLWSSLAGFVVGPIFDFVLRYFTVSSQARSSQPVHMIAPVVGVVLLGLMGGLVGFYKALSVEKTSTPRDEISQIHFSEISQWMKNEK